MTDLQPGEHYWLSTSAGFDVCQRRGCYWQRRANSQWSGNGPSVLEYRSARTEWAPQAEPPCPGREVCAGVL